MRTYYLGVRGENPRDSGGWTWVSRAPLAGDAHADPYGARTIARRSRIGFKKLFGEAKRERETRRTAKRHARKNPENASIATKRQISLPIYSRAERVTQGSEGREEMCARTGPQQTRFPDDDGHPRSGLIPDVLGGRQHCCPPWPVRALFMSEHFVDVPRCSPWIGVLDWCVIVERPMDRNIIQSPWSA